MKTFKKACTLFLSLIMFITYYVPVDAANNTLTYTIYNENGNFVEKGIVSTNNNDPRMIWSSNIELPSGYSVNFHSNSSAFYICSGDTMTLTYTLNNSGTITCRFMKTTTVTGTGSVWATVVKTGSSGTVSKTADASTYYYPRISNTGSNTITITNVTFIF